MCCPPAPLLEPGPVAAAALGEVVDPIVWEPAVLEAVMVEDAVAVEDRAVVDDEPAVLAAVASEQTGAVGNVTFALDSSLVSKLSTPPRRLTNSRKRTYTSQIF